NSTVNCSIWGGAFRAGFSQAPRNCGNCNGGGISPGNVIAPSRAEAPFLSDCPSWNYGSLPSFDYVVDDPAYWDTGCTGYGNYSYMFRPPGFSANMMYLDGHLESIRPKYKGGHTVYYWLWNYNPP